MYCANRTLFVEAFFSSSKYWNQLMIDFKKGKKHTPSC
jgi:hypothetical protein